MPRRFHLQQQLLQSVQARRENGRPFKQGQSERVGADVERGQGERRLDHEFEDVRRGFPADAQELADELELDEAVEDGGVVVDVRLGKVEVEILQTREFFHDGDEGEKVATRLAAEGDGGDFRVERGKLGDEIRPAGKVVEIDGLEGRQGGQRREEVRLQVDGDQVAVAGKPDAEAPQTRRQSLEGVHLVRVEDAQFADRQPVEAGAGG